MRLCKDCRHFSPVTHAGEDGDCLNPQLVWVHPVSGRERYPTAFSTRMGNKCGPAGDLWEYADAYPPESDFVMIQPNKPKKEGQP